MPKSRKTISEHLLLNMIWNKYTLRLLTWPVLLLLDKIQNTAVNKWCWSKI